jgi:predicted transposase YbfD/YdcC
MIEPLKLEAGLRGWLCEVKLTAGYELNIDGKTIRGSIRANFRGCHIVSAWIGSSYLTLGQVKTEAHSNEITAIPELLGMLDINGARITIDAEGCQKAIAGQIIEGGGDYTLAVKENQPGLYEGIKDCFKVAEEEKETGKEGKLEMEEAESEAEKGHGRVERRECAVIREIDWLKDEKEWKEVKSIVRVRLHSSKWDSGEQAWQAETVYDRYFISSLALPAKEMGPMIRRHWSIENNLHWVLDVEFGEDGDKKMTGHAPENMNILRKMALMSLEQHKTDGKKSVKHYQHKAMLNDDYRGEVLFNE